MRHEEAAAFAACGYAKYTGRLGVCLATSGPGGIHLLNGLYDAKCDGQPVLAITGHTFHDLIGTHYQQDVDLDKLFMDVAAYNQRVMGPAHVVNVVDEAIKTALARRTVAHITIPKDIQEWTRRRRARARAATSRSTAPTCSPRAHPLPPQRAAAGAPPISSTPASKVAILAGRGCLGARDEVLELAEKVGAPIIKPLLGKAVVPDDSPYTTGGIGLLGTAPSQDALQECDTLLIAGSGFPYHGVLPEAGQGEGVQIDIDPDAHRPALSRRRRPGRRLPDGAARAAAAGRAQGAIASFLEEGAGAHEGLERADEGARHAHRHADEAAGRDVST